MRRAALYYWPQRTGRPREYRRISDFPAWAILDANELRRQSPTVARVPSVLVGYADRAGVMQQTIITIEGRLHAIYRVRWWLRCPRCDSRRAKLYITRAGPACRKCHRITYARPRISSGNSERTENRPPMVAPDASEPGKPTRGPSDLPTRQNRIAQAALRPE